MLRILPSMVLAFIVITCSPFLSPAQVTTVAERSTGNAPKPYRILTSGKSVTIKSTKDIRNVLVWTSGGHRIVEQKDVNASSFNFRISVEEKVFFLMIKLADNKVYSEKIGI